MSRISGLRNDMNKRTFYKERKINNRSFDFLSKQNIIVPLILDINVKLAKGKQSKLNSLVTSVSYINVQMVLCHYLIRYFKH